MTAAVVHDAKACRRTSGHYLWFASCSCGWWANGTGKEDAERLARQHTGRIG